jgi:hypothetical protein
MANGNENEMEENDSSRNDRISRNDRSSRKYRSSRKERELTRKACRIQYQSRRCPASVIEEASNSQKNILSDILNKFSASQVNYDCFVDNCG